MRGVDILASNMDAKPLQSAMRHYTPEAVEGNAYFVPAKLGPEGWKYLKEEEVRVYVMVGTKEILMDDGKKIVQGMKEAGVDVVYREVGNFT